MQVRLPIDEYKDYERLRREALQLSDQLRIISKKSIGYLLKDQASEATTSLEEASGIFEQLQLFLEKEPYLYSVGGVHIGPEEYIEACLLSDYLEDKNLRSYQDLGVLYDAYLSGLCDMTGELVRYARKYPEKMKEVFSDIEELHQDSLEIMVTRNGSLRKKLEDLERNMKQLEKMIYEWDLRHTS
jgi:predicted translin family RNA/ssDNA-binding protein